MLVSLISNLSAYLNVFFYDLSLPPLNHTLIDKISQANNQFGADLYRLTSNGHQTTNDVISPFLLSWSMAMVLLGAEGNSRVEIRRQLGYDQVNCDDQEVHQGFNQLINLINKSFGFVVELKMANRILVNNKFKVMSKFKKKLKKYYEVSPDSVDFDKSEQIQAKLDDWVKKLTNGRVEKIFVDQFDPDLKLVVVGFAYFKGSWMTRQPIQISDRRFLNYGTEEVQVSTMKFAAEWFNYFYDQNLKAEIVELPFVGRDINLYIILPTDDMGLVELKNNFTQANVEVALLLMEPMQLDLYLPKFRLEQTIDLVSDLRKFNFNEIFANSSDLSGIDGHRDLSVSRVVHQTVVEVDEEGSSGTIIDRPVLERQEPEQLIRQELRVDHPFVVMIRDRRSGVTLFIGQVSQL